ncbi:prephenate dehydrogenase [Candidatus Gottesmanbacteria bacterium]|nr:prephenate dehydrogenase [Candidatus Gottesmanbacteria bacterium]
MKKIPFILNNNEKPTIAIIGFGRFGRLLAQIFLQWSNANILIVSRNKNHRSHRLLSFVNLQNIHSADLIIPCVPISAFKETIQQVALVAKNSAIVMDVCSVKVIPVQIMKSFLPKHIQIIASHPLFGPDSFRINNGLKNLRLVLQNVSTNRQEYIDITSFFIQLGIKVITLSPKKHDQLLAWSLGYSFLVGKIGQKLKIKQTPIDTFDFTLLLQNVDIVRNDSEELFMDMQVFNPYAPQVHKKILKTLQTIVRSIKKRSVQFASIDAM